MFGSGSGRRSRWRSQGRWIPSYDSRPWLNFGPYRSLLSCQNVQRQPIRFIDSRSQLWNDSRAAARLAALATRSDFTCLKVYVRTDPTKPYFSFEHEWVRVVEALEATPTPLRHGEIVASWVTAQTRP